MCVARAWVFGAFFLFSAACSEEPFSVSQLSFDHSILSKDATYLVFLGDTQWYFSSDRESKYYKAALDWVCEAWEKGFDVAAVLNPGDVTNDNTLQEWRRFDKVMKEAGLSMPVLYSTGNHDYPALEQRSKISERALPFFDYFISYHDSLVVARYGTGIDNVLFRIRIQGEPWLVLSLEFGPRKEVLSWASEILDVYNKQSVVLLTHAYLFDEKDLYNSNSVSGFQNWAPKYTFSDAGDGLDIWENVVRRAPQVKMVLCGHNHFSAVVLSENDFAMEVLQLRFDPSNQPNGGNGWLQLLEISKPEAGADNGSLIRGWVYNPILNQVMDDVAGNFEFIIK